MAILPLTPSDRETWERLWSLYLMESQRTLPDDVTATTWDRLLDDGMQVFGLAAWDGAEMIGFVHYLLHPTTWSVQPRCYLNDLFTLPSVRGRGFGKAMIAAVFDHASALGCDRVYWLTHENNAASRRLYDAMAQRSGFIEYRLKIL